MSTRSPDRRYNGSDNDKDSGNDGDNSEKQHQRQPDSGSDNGDSGSDNGDSGSDNGDSKAITVIKTIAYQRQQQFGTRHDCRPARQKKITVTSFRQRSTTAFLRFWVARMGLAV
jgi:hypothetical protein